MTRSRKLTGALAAAAAVIGGVGTYALVATPADAVPGAQEKCTFGLKTIKVEDGWQQLGLGVTLNNGKVSRKAISQLSADMGVVTDAEIRVGYSVDGGAVQEKVYGPGNLANHTEFWQTRSTIAVIPLGPGRHTVRPYWRISGAKGTSGAFEDGCFTVESKTS
ncbi:hypothetical protein [uncultured Friedmanniella sp.]|uniref:hypothetical protein n=1 Tax=uncultured Friedmanniella sp. TaxID=335381 RepID=UPI0035CC6B28